MLPTNNLPNLGLRQAGNFRNLSVQAALFPESQNLCGTPLSAFYRGVWLDVTVDYKCGAGVHEFIVCYAGSRFMLRFPEQALLRRGMQELEQMVGQIVERIRSRGGATTRISASADAAAG